MPIRLDLPATSPDGLLLGHESSIATMRILRSFGRDARLLESLSNRGFKLSDSLKSVFSVVDYAYYRYAAYWKRQAISSSSCPRYGPTVLLVCQIVLGRAGG